MNKILTILLLTVLWLGQFATAHAQDRTLKGLVLDQSRNPVIGASVKLKGTTSGTISNLYGRFSIEVGDGATLEVSAIGYTTQTVAVGDRSSIAINLESDIKNLNSVVVLGYTSKNLSQISSSIATVSADKLEGSSTSSDINDLLQAKIPGVEVSNQSGAPGQSAQIVIRGVGTLASGTNPLYVVDGIVNDANNPIPVNPYDIASITVLKDGAATGLYGSRAANGVIVVTTKRGKAGKTQISYTTKFGFADHLQGNVKFLDSKGEYKYQREAFTNGWKDDSTAVSQANPGVSQKTLNSLLAGSSLGDSTLASYLDSKVPLSKTKYNTDWQKLLFTRGHIQSHYLSVAGGGDKTNFYTSLNYYNETGTILASEYKSVEMRVNLSHSFNDKLSMDVRLNGGFSRTAQDPTRPVYNGVVNGIYTGFVWDHPYNADGSLRRGDETGSDPWLSDNHLNYLLPLAYDYDIIKGNDVNADVVLNYRPVPWLKLSTSNRGSRTASVEELRVDSRTIDAGSTGGYLNDYYSENYVLTSSNLATFTKSFDQHSLQIILGAEFQTVNAFNFTGGGNNLADGTYIANNASSPYVTGGTKFTTAINSYFSQVDYNFASKYFLVGSVRRDGSSKFAPGKNYGNFYSIGGSWLASSEKFLERIKWISLLKGRASYATLGNNDIGDNYPYYGGYSYSSSLFPGNSQFGTLNSIAYNSQQTAFPYRFDNYGFSWEDTHTLNLGLDIAFFNNRIKFTADYYNRKSLKLLQASALQATSGFSSIFKNVGVVRNRGIELNLSTVNVKTKDVNWESNFNISFNKSKVLQLQDHKDVYPTATTYKNDIIISEGHEVNSFYLKKYVGVDPQTGLAQFESWLDASGNVITDAANNGKPVVPAKIVKTTDPNQATFQYFGGFYPKFTAGFYNDFHYKGFGLSFLFNTVYGNKVMNWAARYYWGGYDGTIVTRNVLVSNLTTWHKPGDIAQQPKIDASPSYVNYTDPRNSRFLEDGSFLRLKNISVSYDLPVSWTSRMKISHLQLFVKADNLFTVTKFLGFDPETNLTLGDVDQRYPTAKKFVFGLTLDL